MVKMVPCMFSNITFVCGKTASGKSTLAISLAKATDSEFIEVSSIVKKLLNKSSRVDLTGKIELDQDIVTSLKELLSNNKSYVISGVRQLSIVESFPGSSVIWLQAPFEERSKRFSKREKDSNDLAILDTSDTMLGLKDILTNLIKEY